MNEQYTWIDIITKLYKNLHTSDRVMHIAKESDKRRDRVCKYLERLERVQKKVVESKSKGGLAFLKEYYYDLYVIKSENIPDRFYENEIRLMKERGYGDIELTPERKHLLETQIIEDQRKSLEPWIDYFLFDEEAQGYEIWEKYWVFQGVQQLGKYDKGNHKFSKRDITTVYPFPPVDKEAVFETVKLMEEYIKNKTSDEEIKSALGQGNFKTLYEYSIKQIMLKDVEKLNTIDGRWIKYDQGSDYNILRDSLQGYYTGWCTAAGDNFAKSQLANGDFYVYYTMNENGEAKVPRIAIRMEGHNIIGEIRGIVKDQNMEQEMIPIIEEKLKEFPDRDKYYKKEHDMKYLTSIDNKVKKGMILSKEELRFLYEIDSKIEGFGCEKDPRIERIQRKRDKLEDYSIIFDCDKSQVSDNIDDIINGKGITVFVGNIIFRELTNANGLILPEIIGGSLYLDGLISIEGLVLPKTISGCLSLWCLTSTQGLILPKTMGGGLILGSLTSAEGLILPKTFGGNLYLDGLTSTKGLVLPKTIGGSLSLEKLTSTDGLVLPEVIGSNLYLGSLKSAKGLVLPQIVGGGVYLEGISNEEYTMLKEIYSETICFRNRRKEMEDMNGLFRKPPRL